jgi:hypothetical protein
MGRLDRANAVSHRLHRHLRARTTHRPPDPRPLPPTGRRRQTAPGRRRDRSPATYNTINKWVAGISDTFALGLLAELTPSGIPIAVLPFVNASLAANRVFVRSVAELREASITVLLGDGAFVPHPAGQGGGRIDAFPWKVALDAIER